MQWVVVTGGGSGIGRTFVHHFSKQCMVLTCGRRLFALEETKSGAAEPDNVKIVEADLADARQRENFARALPDSAEVRLLVQNAAIGDPAAFQSVDAEHLEHALKVNVVAPLALAQLFLPALQRNPSNPGRILHLGTSVAHRPQEGTLTYGVTKMAFHRLYQQINAEQNLHGVVCGSLSPGMVDTEGVRDHVAKARACSLPHVKFFDEAFASERTTPPARLLLFVEELLRMDASAFASREWKFSEWNARVEEEEKERGEGGG